MVFLVFLYGEQNSSIINAILINLCYHNKNMHPKRKKRLVELINLMNSFPEGIRYSVLSDFAKKKGVSYETIKNDLIALSYATIPGPKGFNLVYVPRSYRKKVRDIWSLFTETKEVINGHKRRAFLDGEISFSEAQKAAVEFLMHTPYMDIERFRMISPTNEKILDIQDKFAKELGNLIATVKERNVHPVRAHQDAWRIAGVKIHKEIENVVKKVPEDKLEPILEKIWEMNLHKVRAALHYQSFITKYLNLLQREYKVGRSMEGSSLPVTLPIFMKVRSVPLDPEKIWKRLESDIKNLRRWYWPSRRKVIPRNLKESIKALPENIPKDKFNDPFIKAMLDAYTHLDVGDYFYKKAKKIEREIKPFI